MREPLGQSIELGMELVRRNQQLELEVRRLGRKGSFASDGTQPADMTPSYSSDARLRKAEETAQDLSVVRQWAEEAERLQRHACRTLLNAVRKDAPQGREVHQALAQLAAFPPPPVKGQRAETLHGNLAGSFSEEDGLNGGEVTELRLEVSRLNSEAAIMRAQLRGPAPQYEDTREMGWMREVDADLREERRRHLEDMQFMQERLEAAEGIAKELVVKLASVTAVCNGVPLALAQQQAAANAAFDALAQTGLEIGGPLQPRSWSPTPSLAYMRYGGAGAEVSLQRTEASPLAGSCVQLVQSYSCPLLPGRTPPARDFANSTSSAVGAPSRGTAAMAAMAVANAMAAQSQRGRSQSPEASFQSMMEANEPASPSQTRWTTRRSPVEEAMVGQLCPQSFQGVEALGGRESREASPAPTRRQPVSPRLSPVMGYQAGPARWQGSQDTVFSTLDDVFAPPTQQQQDLAKAYRAGYGQVHEAKVMDSTLEGYCKTQAPPPIMVNGNSHLRNGTERLANESPALSWRNVPDSLASTAVMSYAFNLPPAVPMGSESMVSMTSVPPQAPTMRPLSPSRSPALSPGSCFRELRRPQSFGLRSAPSHVGIF